MSDQTDKSKPRASDKDVLPEEAKNTKRTQSEEGFGWSIEAEGADSNPASPQAEPGGASQDRDPHPFPGTTSIPDHGLQETSAPPQGPLSPPDQEAPSASHGLAGATEPGPAPVADIPANAATPPDVEPFSSASPAGAATRAPAGTHTPPPSAAGSAPSPDSGNTPPPPTGLAPAPVGGHAPSNPTGVTPTPGAGHTPPTSTGGPSTPGGTKTPPTSTIGTPTPGGGHTPPATTAARISGLDTDTAREDHHVVGGKLSAGGMLTVSDPDAGEDKFQAVTGAPGSAGYGSFTVAQNGRWTYSADNSQTVIQALRPGSSLVDRVTVHSADGTAHELRVVITGTNDTPVLSAATASATEDGSSVTGQMSATDVDAGDAKAFSIGQPVDGFSMNADGSWSFDPSHAAYQHLAAGQTQQVTIPVTVTDSAGATDTENLVITVTGTNDAPVVRGPVDLGTGTEDKAVPISAAQLLAHATDIDTGDQLSVSSLAASHGTITGDAAHGFTFAPDPNYNGPVTLSYQVTDDHGGHVPQTASLTLGATPDAAVISGVDTGSITEDRNVGSSSAHPLAVSGSLSVHDPDGTAWDHFQYNRFGEHAISDPFGGSLHIDRSGNWGYEVDNTHPAIQALAAGQEGHAVYEVHSADGTAHQIRITIHGTNDAPVLSAATASATEDGQSVKGQMSATDVDTGDTKSFSLAQSVDGFTMNADGSWNFDPSHAAYQHLAAGQTQQVTIPVTVTDSAGATDAENLVITVTGTGDTAVIGGVDTGSVTEWTAGQNMSPDYAQPGMATLSKATLDASGHLSITDPDAGEASFDTHGLGFTYHGTYGDLLLRANGEWFYHADAGSNRFVGGAATTRGTTIDRLGEGQSLTDTITVYSKDGTAHDIVITIHGSNDRPYCSSEVQLAGGTEDVAQTLTLKQLLANTVDVDANDAGKLAIAGLKVDHGSVRDNQDGTFTFTPEKDYDGQVHFTYDVKDAHGGLTHTGATTTLAAVDDAAVITGTGDTLKEDRNLQGAGSGAEVHATGRFHVIDPDGAVQSHFVPHDIGGLLTGSFGGTLQIDENGGYFYSLFNTQVDHLKDGESVQDRFTIQSVDGTTHEVVFTIQGTSDAPVLYRNYQFAFEGTQLVQGQISAGDADKGDAQHLSYATSGTVAGFSLHSDGSYTFDPANAAYDHLGRGDVQRLHIPITVTDPDGLTTNGELEIKLEGTNDAPKVSGAVDLGATREDTAITFSKVALLANATDVDDYDRLHVTGVAVDAHYGTITDNGDGTYTFTPATNYSGTDLPLTFTVQDRAGATTTGTATLDVTAVNDPAMIGGGDTGNVTEDKGVTGGNLTTSGTLTISDPDAGEAAFQPLTGGAGAGTYGTLTLDAQGHWTYTADNSQSAIQGLKTGESLTDTITVTAVDGTTHNVVISIAGTDDAAVISGQTVGDITEDAHSLNSVWETVSGKLTVVDPDHGQSSFTAVSKISDPFTTIGNGLWISSDGHWDYQVTDRGQLQHLAEGETVDVIYEVSTADGTKQRITITVHGTNDVPTASFAGYAPIIDGSGPLSTDEDKAISVPVSSLLTWFSDTDTRDVLGVENLRADHGKISMSPDGQSFVFTPEANYNGKVFFDFAVVDHHGGRTPGGVTMPVRAVADAAVIGGVDTGSVTEDVAPGPHTILNTISTSGNLTISDPDAGESVFVAQSTVKGAYGTFSVNAAGHWTYDANNNQSAVQGLSPNAAPLTETFTVTSRDGTQHDVTISIHGTNDAPVLSAATASATEDGRSVTGQMSATDIDQGDTQRFSIGNPVAGFQMDAHGAWSFDPTDAAYQHLASGQTQQVTIPVTVTDKAGATDTQNLVITVTGTDDATVFGGVQTGDAHEDGNDVHVVGHHYLHDATDWQQITVTDPDGPVSQLTVEHSGQSVIWDMHSDLDIATPYGKFQLVHADGSGMLAKGYYWNYIGDNNNPAVQALKAGETLPPEQLTLVSPDGVRFPLTVTVHGAEDGIRIDTHGTLDHVSEHGPTAPASVGGQLQAHDPDAHDNVSWQPTPTGGAAGRMGTFTVDASGHWEYHVDPAKAAMLGQGMQMFEHFTITAISTDGSQASQRISVEVRGTDQAPDLSASTASATEDGHSISGHMSATDVDVADQKHFTAPSIAGFTLNGDGSWSFDPADAAYQHLADGATQQLTIPVTVTDKAGLSDTKNLVITVTGTNDAAHITGPDSATVVEDRNLSGGFLTAGGTLQVTDTDSSQDSFTPVTGLQGTGGYGSFTIDAQGHWTYAADNSQHAIQQLGHGQSLTDTCVVTSSDGTRHTLNVTIDGTDEAPVVKPSLTAVQGMGTQHLAGTLASGGLGGWAIDNGHGGAVQSLHGQYGTLTINPQTGHFEYHYQQNSGVIKHGGSSTASGQHVDTFHITQQGTAAGDVDVQVQVNVQSVHGNSGHHVDHTVLQGITFTPAPTVQHDAPDETWTDEVTVTLTADGGVVLHDQSRDLPEPQPVATDPEPADGRTSDSEMDRPGETDNGPANSGRDHLAAYFDAIGHAPDAAGPSSQQAEHLTVYLEASGADPDQTGPSQDPPDPAVLALDDPHEVTGNNAQDTPEDDPDGGQIADVPDPVVQDPNDDTSHFGS